MIHHLLPARAEHHIPSMILFLARIHERMNNAGSEPVYVFYGATAEQKQKYRDLLPHGSRSIMVRAGRMNLLRFLMRLRADDSLVLHSAFYPWIWILMFARPRLWKRIAWIMWGADIYGRKSLRGLIYRFIKGCVVRRLAAVSALVEGDFADLQQLIGPCPNYVRAFYSPDYGPLLPCAGTNGRARVVVGNSGWEQADHIPALEWLGRFREQPIEVICPLGYPKESRYKDRVMAEGRHILGEKFHPLPSMLSWDEYNAMLATCDVLVLNNKTQQGLGNVYYMLRGGGKVFLRGDSATFTMLASLGFKINDTRDLAYIPFEELIDNPLHVAEHNQHCYQLHLSPEASFANWIALLNRLSPSQDQARFVRTPTCMQSAAKGSNI